MQNKPNFPHFSAKNDDLTKKQTQFKPNQSQFWPKNKGIKPKQTQILSSIQAHIAFLSGNKPNFRIEIPVRRWKKPRPVS
jgi:hypothetical protein